MRESEIEKYLVEQVELYGGICEKHVSPGRRGVRDRVCLWPHGFTDWVELKKPGEKPEPHQERDHARLRRLGHRVFVIDSKTAVDVYVRTARQRMNIEEGE